MDGRVEPGHDAITVAFPFFVMRGLDPRIHGLHATFADVYDSPMTPGWVYIMCNRPNGTLYVGVTNDIARRAWEHREGLAGGFTKRYGLKRLVYVESHQSMQAAIQREKNLKHWSRAWKVRLILDSNPDWDDLYETLI